VSVATAEGTVKAVPVNGLCEFVKKELSATQWERLLRRFPPEQARFFQGHLLAQEQVAIQLVNDFTKAAAEEKGEPVKQFARRAGRYGAELGLKSVYKFIMMMRSPESVLRKAPFMWTRVYDVGEMTVDAGKNKAQIHIRNFPSHPAGCGRITGWFEVIGEKAGARNLRTLHTSCMAEGGKECLWDFVWTE
jgi:hypothetical protein